MTRARGTGQVRRTTYPDGAGGRVDAATWQIRYYDRRRGHHVDEYGFESEVLAEKALRRRLRSQETTGDAGAAAERLTFKDLRKLIEDDYVNNQRDSQPRLRISLDHLGDHFAGDRAVDITEDRIAAYKRARLNDAPKAKPATVNRELAALKRMFRLAERGAGLRRPYIEMLEEKNVRTGFFEQGQLDAVMKRLPEGLRDAVYVAYVTGWRIHSELLTRRWPHVDFGAGVLRLEPGEAKNEEGRSFPLDPELRPVLERLQRDAKARGRKLKRIIPWVFFHHRDGRPIRRGAFREAWATACRKAGLPGKLLHDLRRTAVRNLERAGVPRSAAMALVGHKTESVYRRYAIVDEAMLRDGAERLAAWRNTSPRNSPRG